jgi:hypothetical protein
MVQREREREKEREIERRREAVPLMWVPNMVEREWEGGRLCHVMWVPITCGYVGCVG